MSSLTLPASTPAQLTTETPTPPTATSQPSPVSITSILKLFPLVQGNTWVYDYTEYTSSPNDALKTIQATYEISRQVVEVKTVDQVTFAHIRHNVKKVSEDPGFSDREGDPSIPDSFWYILHDNKIYSSDELPADLYGIDYLQLTLEYVFPLAKGAEWCPSPIAKSEIGETATVAPCNPIGRRVVLSDEPFQSAAGSFDRCYQLKDEWNTSGIFQTFCEGVGIVEQKFDHSGSLFGFEQTLTRFAPGSASTPLLPTATQVAPLLTDEQVLAQAVMGNDKKTYCSWEILGYQAQGEYVWVYCVAQDAASPEIKSLPVVLMLDDYGHISQVIVPGNGAAYADDVKNLFPPDVQQTIAGIQKATSDFTVQALQNGIKMRASGEINAPYTLPLFDPGRQSCNWDRKPAQDLSHARHSVGWQTVSVPETGFTLNSPDRWGVSESWYTCAKGPNTPHYLFLQPPDQSYLLTIGFRLPDQPVWISRTGTPAGDFVDAGTLTFMGKKVPIQLLVYEKRVVAVFYNGAAEFPASGILFTLSLDITSDPNNDKSIPVDLEIQAVRILASFQLMPSPTPTP